MKTEYIELLKKRIDRIDEKDFDLEGWKSGTTILLSRIFGKDNSYSNEIDDLKVDYSSWSLRDATADYNPKETCKRCSCEILELAIDELHMSQNKEKSIHSITATLQDKSGKLEIAIAAKDEKAILKLLNKENKDHLTRLLAKLLVEYVAF
jgi:hypothetical protein